jgi:hypothetical protein
MSLCPVKDLYNFDPSANLPYLLEKHLHVSFTKRENNNDPKIVP